VLYRANGVQTQYGLSAIVPTPAPTVTSCISDEDVAIQLMRLGNVNSESNTASTMGGRDGENGFISDSGDYGDDGRSDTTELPDLPPSSRENLPDSPILYPRNQKKFKSLDEILPSFDTTEPSDDENQPPEQALQFARPRRIASEDEYDPEGFEDEGDETYVGKEEDDNDADYEDDLDDIPLKMRREKKLSSQPPVVVSKQYKTLAKPLKKQPVPLQSKSKPAKPQPEPHYPISPASPPASRKPSVASSASYKSRSNTTNRLPGTPFSQDSQHFPPFSAEDHPQLEEPRPRCQRCRKSKKGCDRQRPCQRCKDAGIPHDQCISEDEAGTRRGRQAAAAAKKAGMADGLLKPKLKKKKKVV
jgi:hypothetical protein